MIKLHPVKEDFAQPMREAAVAALAALADYDMSAEEYASRAAHVKRVLAMIEAPIARW